MFFSVPYLWHVEPLAVDDLHSFLRKQVNNLFSWLLRNQCDQRIKFLSWTWRFKFPSSLKLLYFRWKRDFGEGDFGLRHSRKMNCVSKVLFWESTPKTDCVVPPLPLHRIKNILSLLGDCTIVPKNGFGGNFGFTKAILASFKTLKKVGSYYWKGNAYIWKKILLHCKWQNMVKMTMLKTFFWRNRCFQFPCNRLNVHERRAVVWRRRIEQWPAPFSSFHIVLISITVLCGCCIRSEILLQRERGTRYWLLNQKLYRDYSGTIGGSYH